MRFKYYHTIRALSKAAFLPLESPNFPFTDYDFLLALEESGSLFERTGWYPYYLALYEKEDLEAFLVAYVKTNSYGEYIFDWDWAAGYEKAGAAYYPKLVGAIPFTPATGTKLLTKNGKNKDRYVCAFLKELIALLKKEKLSGIHHLFLEEGCLPSLQKEGYLKRLSYQYHWKNRSYKDFEGFLCQLKGKRAKEIRRERKKVLAEELEIELLRGKEIKDEHSRVFYAFYKASVHKKQAFDYLTPEFFDLVFKTMKDRLVLCLAKKNFEPVAASLSFCKGNKLFGRYFGALKEYSFLHFELCYYLLIEFAIKNGIDLFEAGAQGEHKKARGFETVFTYSAHHMAHAGFSRAISDYIDHEARLLRQMKKEDAMRSPYR